MTMLGLPSPAATRQLGAVPDATGTAFAVWAPRASKVDLVLVADDASHRDVAMVLEPDGVWVVRVDGIGPGQAYGFRAHGDWNPDAGERFNAARLLVDPYARAIAGHLDYRGPIFDHTQASNYLPNDDDSAGAVPLSIVVAPSSPPRPIARRRCLSESVIAETHLKGYTRLHPDVPDEIRGTYAGMAHPAVIEHLLSIGVTAVEFLPVQHFVSEPFVVDAGLVNYWGYNTLGFFAPHGPYSSSGERGEQVAEFKQMVSALHDAGLEVILDVVYNHTAEGGHDGPTLSFRGLDHGGYYRLTDGNRNDYDVTGCGNSIDTSQPAVLRLVLDSLRYWVGEMGVDGFRFDLAPTLIRDGNDHIDHHHPFKTAIATDPLFQGVKLIAEPWDIGPYGYQLGHWEAPWSEWNDRYRNYVRDYWRGAVSGVQELATRLSGSPDVYLWGERPLTASVNFVTCHDGFTLRDVVTYNLKRNQANKEHNRDGTDDNRSWNCGVEGETDDPAVNRLRRRQAKNMVATLLLSHGVPMVASGDEFGRTQGGNNNAYCQDNGTSWVAWDPSDRWNGLLELTATLTRLRAAHPALRPREFLHRTEITDDTGKPFGRYDLAWLNGFSGEMTQGDWHDMGRQTLGMYSSDDHEAFVTWFHAGDYPLEILLPDEPWGAAYRVLAHTGESGATGPSAGWLAAGTSQTLAPRTVTLMEVMLPEPYPDTVPTAASPSGQDDD